MTAKQIADNGGCSLNVIEIGGRLYSPFSLESLNNTFTFKARPDDVLLCAYPKSGTAWTYEIIRLLLAGTTDLPLVEKLAGMIEHTVPSKLDEAPSPRNLNTHYHFDALSPDFLRQKCKIIYVTRDPRDVAVSYFNHHKSLKDFHGYGEGKWENYFPLQLEGQVDYDSWFDYTKGWEKCMKENPDHPFLVVSYESMKKKPFEEIKRISEFLGKEHSHEFLNEVVEKTDFSSMKKNKIANGSKFHCMLRKGQTGDWKNWFTVAQSEVFNEVFEREMAGSDAYKPYSHSQSTAQE